MIRTRVLAIDLGTSSVRSAVFDHRGRRLADTTAQRAYPLRTDAHGRAELDPRRVLGELRSCLAESSAAVADGPAITAVGISSFWHGLLGLDGQGRPATPIITWADSRCAGDAARLRRRWDEAEVHGRTGCMLRASFWPAKLAWLRRTDPALVARVRRWCAPVDWLVACLHGWDPLAMATAHGMATATGLYDPRARAWDRTMLRRLGLPPDRLPPISDGTRTTGPALARRLPVLARAAWHPAIGDGAASNLGAGATSPGTAAITFGTSAAVRIVRTAGVPRAPFGLFCYRIDERRFLIGGAVSNAGGLRAWGLDHLRLPPADELERQLSRRTGPDHGLTVLPCWLAERAPTWPEDLRGAVLGITQATTGVDLLQAITEAACLRLAGIVARVPGARGLRLIVGGGIQRSPSSLARLANAIGQPLTISDDPETSLRGAAVLALERLGGPPPPAVHGATVRPSPALVARYRRQRLAQESLEARLGDPSSRPAIRSAHRSRTTRP